MCRGTHRATSGSSFGYDDRVGKAEPLTQEAFKREPPGPRMDYLDAVELVLTELAEESVDDRPAAPPRWTGGPDPTPTPAIGAASVVPSATFDGSQPGPGTEETRSCV